jgi:Domain of unknown function (DUF4401)
MNAPEAHTLWLRLQAAGLVEGETPAPGAAAAPWFVRAMLGIAGWIGAVFLLGFVGLGFRFVMESAGASFIVGLLACGAAGMLFRARPESDFATQFGLAVSLAGQGLVLFALIDELDHQTIAIALGLCLFEAMLFFAMPNFVHRVWSAWAGACAVVFALSDWQLQAYAPGLLSLACAWVWLNEFRYARHGALLRAGGYGLVLALITASGMLTWTSGDWLWRAGGVQAPASAFHLWTGAGSGGVALLWSVWRLLIREAVAPATGAGVRILAATLILALATLKAPGLAPATLILLLGFSNGNRVLFGLGVASLLGFLSFYYYSLQTTLLYKSALMAGTGLALLSARFLLLAWWPAASQGETRDA